MKGATFVRPALRPGVTVQAGDGTISVDYRRQGCTLDVPEGARADLLRVLDSLGSGSTVDALAATAGSVADGVPDLLRELDRLGLLVETGGAPAEAGVTGAELYRDARRIAGGVLRDRARSEFHTALVEGTATREQLVGYAVEYFHVVRLSPGLIAPALAHAWPPAAARMLQEFVAGEIGHDALLAAALTAAGLDPVAVADTEPLPATFTVCATLGVTAAQDPVAFAACLFLVEEPSPAFDAAFAHRAAEVGLPDEFAAPLIRHSDINADAGHDDISRALLATVPYLSAEHRQGALKHVVLVAESLAAMEREILDHYGTAR